MNKQKNESIRRPLTCDLWYNINDSLPTRLLWRMIMYEFPEELRKAYEAQPIALVYDEVVDGKAVPLLLSDGFLKLVGMDRERAMEWFKKGQYERVHPDDVGRVARVSESFGKKESGYDIVLRTRHPDGYRMIHAVGKYQTMPDGTELAVLTYFDITENMDAVASMIDNYQIFQEDHFYTDLLTKLPNINYLNQYAEERVHAIRTQGKTPVLLYVDVIAMQYYNNQYGYEKGNELLCLIGKELKAVFPEALICRGSDDHFVLIDAFEGQKETENRIISADNIIRSGAYGNTTGIRAGVCVMDPETKMKKAVDRAKSALKWLGTDLNRVCHFYTSMAEDILWNQRYVIENFDQALEKGWIKVYYQGIVDTVTGEAASLEALARWVDPVRGILSPGEFIPALEMYHLLYKLDLYIAEQVCREMPARKEIGLPDLPVSVNFSAHDFDYIDIPSKLNEIYTKYRGEEETGEKKLIVEITEQDMAKATERFQDQLRWLKANGFHIWLDDFGSGYSSLNVFGRFDVDMIKYDMDFMRRLDENKGANRRIMKAMTELAKEMGILTLAEGIETEEQWHFLQEIGCELAQGYLFHRPEPLDAIVYRIRSERE